MNSSEYEYLDKINSPSDLKKLSIEELNILCEEIRDKLIKTVSKNGGHLSPNLGTVELTVAMHYVYNTPNDKIVWDVGHQSYTHKILTGRKDRLDTIRKKGGLSGFPKRSESPYDAFNVGHSSTSISAAYGIARARAIKGEKGRTIAVIGDGALTGGLAYEGLNNAGRSNKNFTVILNDNKMSISRNVGSIAKYLTHIRIRPGYIKIKKIVEKILIHTPVIGNPLRKLLLHSKSKLRISVYRNTIFEDLGFVYYGPVDGHDIGKLIDALNASKNVNQAVIIHVVTTKGKGYHFAEEDPRSYHGISSFDIESGEPISSKKGFSARFGEILCDIAKKDKRICAITAAMKLGTGLAKFSHDYKERFFDVGIAEEHAVTFAAGLATENMIPVFAVYSSFLQRAYDQIIHDAAAQEIHMVLAIDRAGIVGEDGETHQGVFDVAMLSSIPNVTIYSPCYFDELGDAMNKAIYKHSGIVAIRYPRGGQPYRPNDYKTGEVYSVYGTGKDAVIVTYGRIFANASNAKEILEEKGKKITILKLNRIHPISKEAVKICSEFKRVYFFEEGMENGGVGDKFRCMLDDEGYTGSYELTAIKDKFVPQSTVDEALSELCLDCAGIVNKLTWN